MNNKGEPESGTGSTLHPALEILASAVMSERDAARPNLTEEQIATANSCLAADLAAPTQLLRRILPDGPSVDSDLHERLYRVASIAGFNDGGAEIVGQIWAAALLSIEERDRQELLMNLPTGHQFFVLLQSYPFVLKTVRFEPTFLIQHFIKLRELIGNDLMQGGYWRGIEAWASSFLGDAVHGLEILLLRDLDDDGIAIGAAILGSLRVAWERQNDLASLAKLTDELTNHRDVTKRVVYHRSWINTGWIRGLSDSEFMHCLERMTEGVSQERNEAFNFLRCLILDSRTGQHSLDFGVAWLCREANATLPDQSKHWIANIIHRLGTRWVHDDGRLESLRRMLLAVQPVPKDNKGTWTEIEYLLVDLLHKNRPQFARWLFTLLDANPKGILEQFRKHGRFEYLCSEMMIHGVTDVISPLFFSILEHQRVLAFVLYDKLPFDSFTESLLSRLSDDEIALSLFELQRHYLEPKHVVRFLLALRQRAETGANQVKGLFRSELLYQAKNFPGAVLDGLKGCTDKSTLLQEVIAEADVYFDKLRTTHHSAINSMEIPGWRRAMFIRSRRQNRDIETHSEEHNVLAQMFSKSYLIYGGKGFRYCRDGEIGEFSPMQSMSVSMEMPRLAMIDPEGTAIRRVEIGRILDRLSEAISKKKTGDQ